MKEPVRLSLGRRAKEIEFCLVDITEVRRWFQKTEEAGCGKAEKVQGKLIKGREVTPGFQDVEPRGIGKGAFSSVAYSHTFLKEVFVS